MRDLFVSVSQLKTFKTCPRRWFLQSREKLQKAGQVEGDALRIGKAFHAAMEVLHGPREPENSGRLAAALDRARMEMRDTEVVEIDGFEFGAEDAWESARVAGMVRAYAAFEMTRGDGLGVLESTERGFPDFESAGEKNALTLGVVQSPDGPVRIVLTGRWDGADKRMGVVEHKTAGRSDAVTIEDLAVDEQVSGMCWAATQLYGRSCLSAVYNVVVKPEIKYKPRGIEETPADFEARITKHMLDSPGRHFVRMLATRTPAALEQWRQDAVEAATQMVNGPWWPALRGSWDGPCRHCEFRPLCESWHDKERVRALKAGLYEARQRR